MRAVGIVTLIGFLMPSIAGAPNDSVQACTTYLNQQNDQGNTPSTLRFLTMNLDWSAHEIQKQMPGEYLKWIPYFLLIAAVIFTGWYQVRQTQARTHLCVPMVAQSGAIGVLHVRQSDQTFPGDTMTAWLSW